MTTPPPGAHKTLQIDANPNVALITGITGQDGSYFCLLYTSDAADE